MKVVSMASSESLTTAVFVIFSLTQLTSSVEGSKILVYPFGHCLNSHLLNAEQLGNILADSGHSVDLLVSNAYNKFAHRVTSEVVTDNQNYTSGTTEIPRFERLKNKFRLVQYEGPDNHKPVCDYDTIDYMLYASIGERFKAMLHTGVTYCDFLLSDKILLRRLKSTGYDVIIVEAVDPCSRIIADFLDVPFILFVTTGLGHFDNNPRPPSYLPAAIAPYSSHMDFAQRLANLVIKMMYDCIVPALFGFMTPFNELRQKHQLNATLSLEDTFNRAAIRLVNSDFAIEYPAPIEPDTVLVGGFAVGRPETLAVELEDFIAGSGEAGIIVVSFGTLAKRFGRRWTNIFATVFGRLKQRVIWRYHGDDDVDVNELPDNVLPMRWLPQTSLLAHPKTRMFISHCGLNALFEAAHFGVPVLAVPLSGDQFNNAAKVSEHLHMGLTVNIMTMTVESLYRDVRQLLSDERYSTNARSVAHRLADQPLSAAEKIRFWVDYVIRNHGAAHLRSEARQLPWYQYLSLDVILFLFIACLVTLTIVAYVIYRSLLFVGKLVFKRLAKLVRKTKSD